MNQTDNIYDTLKINSEKMDILKTLNNSRMNNKY